MKRFFVLALLVIAGCTPTEPQEPPPVPMPPLFGRGDLVRIDNSSVGIVIDVKKVRKESSRYDYDPRWNYSVAFRDTQLNYWEEQLKLVKRFDWNQPLVKPEIEKGEQIKLP